MRILIDARMYGSKHTGIGRYVKNLVENLQSLDKKNTYILLLKKKWYRELKLEKNWKKVLADIDHYSLKEQIYLPIIVKRINPDLVHYPHFNVPLFFSGDFVVTIHDMIMHESKGKKVTNSNYFLYLFKHSLYRVVFLNAVKKAKFIITPSNFVKSKVLNSFSIKSQKIVSIKEGFDKEVKPQKEKRDVYRKKFKNLLSCDYFIYAGNAYPHKNIETLLDSFKNLVVSFEKGSKREIKLVIVTKNNQFGAKIKLYVKSIEIEDKVVFLHDIKDDELGFLYKNSLAFIFPSLSEGFGLPGLEAIYNSTLVCASRIPVFKEIYKDSVIFFDPKNKKSLTSSMTQVIKLKKSERNEKIKHQKKILKEYSFKKMARDLLEIYQEGAKLEK